MIKHPLFFIFLILITPNLTFTIEPTAIINGLAVYKIGEGESVLLMPYPHASTLVSMAENSLVKIINDIGKSVITFDPPGAYNSTRTPKVDLDEMLTCTKETLDYFGIEDSIDFVGHSMGSFCALAFSIENQSSVKRLVLIGSTSGWPAVRKWGVHKTWKWWKDKEYWQCMYWGTRIMLGMDNLKIHKKLDQLVEYVSFVDKKYVPEIKIEENDHKKPAPIRAKWMNNLRKGKIDYRKKLHLLNLPVLICVGKYDPQTPVIMNEELNEGIKNSQLIIFNNSGHSPFIEEKDYFTQVIKEFLE